MTLEPYISKKLRKQREKVSSIVNAPTTSALDRGTQHVPPMLAARLQLIQNRTAPILRLPSKSENFYSQCPAPVVATRWSLPYGQLLASAGLNGRVYLYKPLEQTTFTEHVWEGPFHNGGAKDIQWNFQGTSLLSCGSDGYVLLYDVQQNKALQVGWLRRFFFFKLYTVEYTLY
jgi:hypothetical protein